ncbi:MAG: cytochrome c [Nitrospirota bacterium]|nr:cytochrome c [Nitrospirota bacterium]
MALRISLLCLTTVLLLTAGRASAAPPVGIPEQGRPIFEARCASCHGPQGRGDGPQAPFLSPRPASLISAGTSVKTDAELLAVITNGKPRTSMPAWNGLLTEQERRDVLAYIRTLVRFHPHSLTPPPNGQN